MEMKAQGCAILMVSVELEEALSLSDRILVMSNGEQTGMVNREDADEKSLGLMMAGIEEDAA
jgi:simple sugar transport system ATP-binding protein